MQQRKPTSVETFAGGGGFLIGSHAAGFDCRLAIDIEPKPLNVIADYIPGLNVHAADFLSLDAKRILFLAGLGKGKLDHFHGSWPCCDFSMVNAKGRKDVEAGDETIYRLLNHFIDTAIELRPKIITGENVDGAVSGDALRMLKIAAGRLRAAGYDVIVEKVKCLEYGVPQDRSRVILMAKLKSIPGQLRMPPPPPIDKRSLTISKAFPGVLGAINWSYGARRYTGDRFLPTVTASKSIEFWDGEKWRNPTVSELLAAQTFPSDYEESIRRTGMCYTDAHRLIGNAVPSQVALVVMDYLKKFVH